MNRFGILIAATLLLGPCVTGADVTRLTCDDSRVSQTEFCDVIAAQTRHLDTVNSPLPRQHDIVGGSFSVLQDTSGATVQGYAGPIVLPEQTFLTGRMRADCLLAQLPFASASGTISLVPLMLDGLGEARQLSISKPRPSDANAAGLSCDGQRIYLFDYEYDGLMVFDVSAEDQTTPQNWSENQALAVVSHTGCYVAALGGNPGTYVLQDFADGNQVIFDAALELDYPFFSPNYEHLFMVRTSDGPPRTEIFSLPDMIFLAEVPDVLPSGIPIVSENDYLITPQ